MKLPMPLLALTLLAGCNADANHLGNPLTWPAMAVESALSNAVYDTSRAKVSAFVTANHAQILSDAKRKSGPALTAAMDLAQVPEPRRTGLAHELASTPLYRQNPKALVVALMAHGG